MSRTVPQKPHATLAPLAVGKMPLAAPPPKTNRFGSPLNLRRVHWVRPELVAEVTFLTWTSDGLLRQVTYPSNSTALSTMLDQFTFCERSGGPRIQNLCCSAMPSVQSNKRKEFVWTSIKKQFWTTSKRSTQI
jgi:hypothetical protein